MGTALSTSSPSFERSVAKLHPYQKYDERGPKGAFDAKKIKDGFHVRVDMPGVPDDGVKVVKYNHTRTVTFSGEAPTPTEWAQFESSSGRVYGGYVVLDLNPADIDFKAEVKNGCLRLFFPSSDGSLRFLSPKTKPPQNDETDLGGEDEEIPAHPTIAFIEHAPKKASGIRLVGGSGEEINPYKLSGVQGVYEHKAVKDEEGVEMVYVRLDVPGNFEYAILENFDRVIKYSSESECEGDEGGRRYRGFIAPACECCKYEVVKHELTHGVLRFMARKTRYDRDLDTPTLLHSVYPPRAQPSVVEILILGFLHLLCIKPPLC